MVDVDAVDTASLVFWSASLGLTLSFLIMGFLSVRGKGDPARTGAKWYKVASVLILLWCVFGVAIIAYTRRDAIYIRGYGREVLPQEYLETAGQLQILVALFKNLAVTTLVVTQIHMAVGLQYATGSIDGKPQTTSVHLPRTLAAAVLTVVLLLSMAQLALNEWQLYNDYKFNSTSKARATAGLGFALSIIKVLFAGYSLALTLAKTRSSNLVSVNIHLVAASFLTFAATLYMVVISGIIGLQPGLSATREPIHSLPDWIGVVQAIFNPWFIAMALALSCNVLKKTSKGLWTGRYQYPYV